MRNYIRAELYRTFNRITVWATIISGILIGGIGIALISYMNKMSGNVFGFDTAMHMGVSMLSITGFLSVLFIEIIIGEDIRLQTPKNVLMSGLSREKFYLAKWIVQGLLGTITLFLIVPAIIGLAWMILPRSEVSGDILLVAFKVILGLIPLCLGCIAYGNVVALFLRNTTMLSFIYPFSLALANVPLLVLGKFVHEGFYKINGWMLYTQLTTICDVEVTDKMLGFSTVVGLVSTVLWLIIGVVVIRKQEIK